MYYRRTGHELERTPECRPYRGGINRAGISRGKHYWANRCGKEHRRNGSGNGNSIVHVPVGMGDRLE